MDIVKQFDHHLGMLKGKFEHFPWQDRLAYGYWLAQTYYFVQHTTRLLALSASKFGPDQNSSHQHTIQHLREESGHDMLAVKDMKAMGFEPSELAELPQTSIFYQTQYYWVDHRHPVALQGYALMLEGLAAREAGAAAALVEKHHGKGKTAFLRVHAADDIEHFGGGLKELAKVDAFSAGLVLRNLEQSAWLYAAMLDGIVQAAKAGGTQKRVA